MKAFILFLILAGTARAVNLTLSWSSSSAQATSVVVERSYDNINYVVIATVPGSSTSITDYSVPYPLTLYYRAKNVGDGVSWSDSDYCDVATYNPLAATPVVAPPAAITKLPKPANLVITAR